MGMHIAQTTSTQVAGQYFDAFKAGDLERIVGLFAPSAVVKSSSAAYQEQPPRAFYEKILGLTQDKTITVHSIAVDQSDRHVVIVHFDYRWTQHDGTSRHFPNAFDRFEIDPATGKIRSLIINLGADIAPRP